MLSTNYHIYGTNFVRTRSVPFLWPIDFSSSPKLWQHHNIMGRVIWWVLSEIQSLQLCNPPTAPFTVRTSYELEVFNFFYQLILDRPQLGQSHNMLGGVIRWVLKEIQSLELHNAPTTPFMERSSNKLAMSNFFDQLISDRSQNCCNIIIWWEKSFDEFCWKSNP